MSTSPYETLGVRRNASAKTINKAYRQLALKYHPDRNVGDPEAAVRFEAVQKAYELLRDVDRRRRYDESGDSSEPRASQHLAAELMQVLGPCLSQVAEQLVDQHHLAEKVDVVHYMRVWLKDARDQRVTLKAKVDKMLTFHREAVERIRAREGRRTCSRRSPASTSRAWSPRRGSSRPRWTWSRGRASTWSSTATSSRGCSVGGAVTTATLRP